VIIPERCRVLSAPDSLIANIVTHYGRSVDCYNSLLDTAFHFYPDIQDSLERENPPSPNPFEGWNRDVEISVTTNISTRVDTISVFFDSEYAARSTQTNPATETRYYNYHLLVRPTPASTVRYQGQAEVKMLQGTGSWTLVSFRDHRDLSGLPTWGSFRADERLGP
jgi:hypothetical protein